MISEEQAPKFLRLARMCARRRMPGATAEQIDDVVSTAILKASKGPSYDVTKGGYGTWVRVFVEFACIDERKPNHEGIPTVLEEYADVAYYSRWLTLNRLLATADEYDRCALTSLERETLQAFTTRDGSKEVADFLGLTQRGVEKRLEEIYRKLGTNRLHRALLIAASRYEIVL